MTSSACKSDLLNFLLVFTVKSSNIEIKTIQWNKSRNWDMKGGKYTKIFAKDSGQCNFSYSRYSAKFCAQSFRPLYGDAMLVPIQMGANMEVGNQQKHVTEF